MFVAIIILYKYIVYVSISHYDRNRDLNSNMYNDLSRRGIIIYKSKTRLEIWVTMCRGKRRFDK